MNFKDKELKHCFQYEKRMEMAEIESHDEILLDKIKATDFSFSNATVKPVPIKVAKEMILKYEYLGTVAAINKLAFGLYFGELLSGVVIFGHEYSINLPFWQERYSMDKNNTILLSRGVCTWWCPKNANSFLVSNAIKLLPSEIKVVTCTVDPMAKEKGTIYQACNFKYLGSMRDSNPNLTHKKGQKDRTGCVIDGKLYTSRSMRQKFGTMKRAVILEKFPDAEFIKVRSKHRYVFFRGSHKEKKFFQGKFEHLIKPHPKDYIE